MSSRGGGGEDAHPLHTTPKTAPAPPPPPPRTRTPCTLPLDPPLLLFLYVYCLVSYQTFVLRHFVISPVCNTKKVPFLANLLLFRTSGPKRPPVKEI